MTIDQPEEVDLKWDQLEGEAQAEINRHKNLQEVIEEESEVCETPADKECVTIMSSKRASRLEE